MNYLKDGIMQVFFPLFRRPILSHGPNGKRYVLSNFKGKIPHSRNKKRLSPFCDLIIALCDSKMYFYIPNVEICLLVNQIFDFLFNNDLIKLYSVYFSPIWYKKDSKNSQFWVLGHVPKMGRKNTVLINVTFS